MEYDAVTIDTSIFKNYGLNLEGGILNLLTQFNNGYTDFILSEIVIREVRQHLIKDIKEAIKDMERAIDKVNKYKVAPDDIVEQLRTTLKSFTSEELNAENRLKSFLLNTGVEIVPVNLVDVKNLVANYFDAFPPFMETGAKKHEFPDAIALLSLEHWAELNQQKILAVSSDKGWREFAANSKWIDLEEKLPAALSKLQRHAETAYEFIEQFIADIDCGTKPDLMHIIMQSINNTVSDSSSFSFEASSDYEFVSDDLNIEIEDLTFHKSEDKYHFSLVRTGKNLVVTSIALSLSITVTGNFAFFEFASPDQGYRAIGEEICTTTDDLNAEILLTFEGDFSKQNNEIKISKIELTNLDTIDLGDIGPDLRYSN